MKFKRIKSIWHTIKTAFDLSRVVRRFNKIILYKIGKNYNELKYIEGVLLRDKSIHGDKITKTYLYKHAELSVEIIKFKIELLKCFKF